jgi:fumarate reductase subunit D
MEQNPSSEPKVPTTPSAASEPAASTSTSSVPATSTMSPVTPVSAPASAPVIPPAPAPQFAPKDVEAHKFVAALSYLGILVFVPLLLKRDSAFVRMHSAQGILMLVVWMVAIFLIWIPLIGWLIGIALALAQLVALVTCLQGGFWEIPVIGVHRKKLQLD